MSNSPLYEIIFKEYKEKIISGELPSGSKLPTEMEIAESFNVSRITVTRALKELELSNFIHRIKGSGSYVNDDDIWETAGPNRAIEKNISIISLILPFEGNFSFDIFRGIEDVAKENNYLVTFHNSSDNPETERNIIEDLTAKNTQGMILYPAEKAENMDLYSKLLIDKYPFVLLDREIPGIDASLVRTDNKKGFYDITSHLIELGHSRIIFAGTSVYSISSELNRYKGFCKAHMDHGIPLMQKHLFTDNYINQLPDDYRAEESIESRQCNYIIDLLENMEISERPTAIAAVNDQIAEVIIRTALKRGIKIPEDYSVTGFDNLPFSSHLPVPLTTVEQPVYEIGRMAAEELFKRIKFPGRKVSVQTIDSSILLRETTCSLKN